jgi:hypothetical protein
MKLTATAIVFLALGLYLGSSLHPAIAHAQAPDRTIEIVPRSELVEKVGTDGWVPNFKGAMRAVSLSCVPGPHDATCYVLLQSN